MLFMPPRHTKSEGVTIRYPVFRIEQDTEYRVIVGAYNQTLANKFSRKSRRIAKEVGITLATDRTAVDDWETTAGGGMRAVGVGGGITGQGGDLIIIDDPVKSREEANSMAYRDKVYDWYTDDLYTRLEPNGAIILIMTRWHEDDLAGRILNSDDGENWKVINLPAIAEDNDPIGRKIGEALCPERFDLPELQNIKRVLGRAFWGLYQQRPQEQEGELFKRSWFEIIPEIDEEIDARCRYWDFAATQDGGDYTVGALIARSKRGTYYVEDIVRGQWSTHNRNNAVLRTAQEDILRGNVSTCFEEEGGSSGKDASAAIIKLLSGYNVHARRVTGSKEVRAEPFAAQCEGLNVKIVKDKWNEDYIDELTSFPNGANDDQVDASSGGFNEVAINSIRISAKATTANYIMGRPDPDDKRPGF